MILLLQTAAAIFLILVVAEVLWRAKLLEAEHSRKLVHIVVGTFAATWAFYMQDQQILLLAGAMFLVVVISRLLGIFSSIHSVKRKTWGELFFPIGIALSALLTDSPWIFLAAILHVSLADGLAAVVGRRYVRTHGYKVLGQQKTLVGSLAFFNASLFIVISIVLLVPELQLIPTVLLLVPALATAAENLGLYGSDDLLVPLIVTVLLTATL